MKLGVDINVLMDLEGKMTHILNDKLRYELEEKLTPHNILDLVSPEALKIIYEDYIIQVFGFSKTRERNMIVNLNEFLLRNREQGNVIDLIVFSNYKFKAASANLHFLSKYATECKKVIFYDDLDEILKECDYFITENPKMLEKNIDKIIKYTTFYNEGVNKEEIKIELKTFENLFDNLKL